MENQHKTLKAPKGETFASQFMTEIPTGYWIDKQIAGCGLTTLALYDKHDSIILVPRTSLIENKTAQHEHIIPVQGGISAQDAIAEAQMRKLGRSAVGVKIMATYNALALGKLDAFLDAGYHIYVDESQFLLTFAKEHPELLAAFHSKLEENIARVSFFSARPPKIDYMPQYIRDMNKMVIEWTDTVKAIPYVINTPQVNATLIKLLATIERQGYFEYRKGKKVTKAIIFVNSVTAIKNAVKRAGLNTDDVAYIVGDTVHNATKLRGIGSPVEDPKSLPKYTFITSTGLAGIDLYDEEAMTIVVSNTSKNWTMFDMELDVPQAISRQRMVSNKHGNGFLFLLDQTNMEEKIASLEETFNRDLETTWAMADILNETAEEKLETVRNGIKENYLVALETKEGKYVANEAYLLALRYDFEELFKQYQEGYTVRAANSHQGRAVKVNPPTLPTYEKYAEMVKTIDTKKELEEFLSDYVHNSRWRDILRYGWDTKKVLIDAKQAKKYYESRDDYKGVILAVRKKFRVGNFYPTTKVRKELDKIYKSKGLNKKAKATDLHEFMTVKVTTKRINTKKTRGIEVVSHTITK